MFVGWQSRGSLGRALVDGAKQVEINGKTLAAHIATLNGFSAHETAKAFSHGRKRSPVKESNGL
jgi:metallo-beta-lactamase family protein